jgi:nucleoside 2-deoxyribosyltransferase
MSQSPSEDTPQRVFVMMPFASDFYDVYAIVKDSIAAVDESMQVIRLDEIRAAGSITNDLITEIRKATLCLADVTDAHPNVMWELGYATALGKPVVVITQRSDQLPFDIKDVRTVQYSRKALSQTLRDPLTEMLKATLERYVTRRSALRLEQQQPRVTTIAITGSMEVRQADALARLERLLGPYIGSNYHWYVGSYGGVDEAVLSYLLESREKSITVVGHSRYDISEQQLRTLEENKHLSFIDAEREQVPPTAGAPSKRDIFLSSRADLMILIWDRRSEGTKALMDWLSATGKDHIIGFT